MSKIDKLTDYVRVSDLPELTGRQGQSPILRCPECGETYSANHADYWLLDQATIMKCGVDGETETCEGVPLELVVREVRYKPWRG